MKLVITLIFLFTLLSGYSLPQQYDSQQIYNSYSRYKEQAILHKRFKHSHLKEKIKELKKSKLFNIEIAGKSLEKRDIYLLSIGKGKTRVLLWSQMHGDESTATMALFDLFNFFNSTDEFDNFKKQILNKLTIYIIPMLNPDGAEKFQRRNELDIDLNRDALRLEFPESRLLKSVRDSLNPQFAFNLHDQNTRYTSGNSYHSATISFLAPSFNYEKEVNDIRRNAMKLIVDLYSDLNNYIPGHIAKYKDDFEPRAFGDNFIKWGTSSVLIESGGWKNDEEKQFIRKLNFIALLTGFNSIANKLYKKADVKIYQRIPFNDNLLFDLLIRNLTIKYKSKKFKIDLGINREEKITMDHSQVYYVSKIEDWGDLSVFYGYDEYDLDGYEIRPSKIFSTNIHQLSEMNIEKLFKGGYGFVELDTFSVKREYSGLPFNIIIKGVDLKTEPKYDGFANFSIWKNNKLHYNVINGFIYDINSDIENHNNGIIFR